MRRFLNSLEFLFPINSLVFSFCSGIGVGIRVGGDADEAGAHGGEEEDSHHQPAARAGGAAVVTWRT